MTVGDFLKARGMNPHQLSQCTGIAYSTLHPHVKHGKPLGLRTAQKLATWSNGAMTVEEILGLAAGPVAAAPADTASAAH
jgi:hypothetical protein